MAQSNPPQKRMVGRSKVTSFMPFAKQNMPKVVPGAPKAPGLRTPIKSGKNLGGKALKLKGRK